MARNGHGEHLGTWGLESLTEVACWLTCDLIRDFQKFQYKTKKWIILETPLLMYQRNEIFCFKHYMCYVKNAVILQ